MALVQLLRGGLRGRGCRSLSSAPAVSLLIDGKLVTSAATEFTDVHNPATGELLCRTPHATPGELQAAISSAISA